MEPKDMKLIPQWNQTKEEIWQQGFACLEESQARQRFFSRRHAWYAIAASIALLLAATLFAYLYTLSWQNEGDETLSFVFPDGSRVSLNTNSALSHKPYWWFIERQVEMHGEACFEVKKGKPFTVASAADQTVRVLGTSFHVLAREAVYQVTCLRGSIEVSAAKEKTRLTTHMRLTMAEGQLRIDEEVDARQSLAWMEHRFSFNGLPLSYVIAEIERYYQIRITSPSALDYYYTGNFSKDKQPEEILEIIGKPFGIHFSIVK
ncbi:MAG: FecR domain-containing protein [Tannerellaceae bacterium]|jgi:ferric-dicitrate binding protein FerR (iron transport regulator)|nr:FecR domain-containing protein [Tannerellaceae bacterium]